MMGKELHSEAFKVGLVAAACIVLIAIVNTLVLHVQAELAVTGPIILFLGYLVSDAWAPIPEWNPAQFWSVAIIFTTIVEIVFSFLL